MKEAVLRYKSALRHSNSPTAARISAGQKVLRSCVIILDWQQAYEDSSIAIHPVPKLTLRSPENSDKQYLLSQVAGLACNATAVALQAGKAPLVALDLLEQGRGILAASLEEMRTDISDLRRRHPELADKFVRLRDELESPVTRNTFITDEMAGYSYRREQAGVMTRVKSSIS